MKKIVVTILILTMMTVFAGCGEPKSKQAADAHSGSSESPISQYESDGTEKAVSITDFMDMMMCDRGKWDCPSQYNDYALEFSVKEKRPLVNISKRDAVSETSVNLIAEVGSVSYHSKKNIYCVVLLEYDMPLAYKELHIDVSAIGEGVIHTENIYDDYNTAEFVFAADSGDFIQGAVSASGTVPAVSESTDRSAGENPGIESQTWVLKDESLLEDYKPLISLDSAGYFSFKENLYSGMGHYYGVYTDMGTTIECTVYSIDFSGYAGDNVYHIVFEKTSPTILTLKTDMCYSCNGAVFELQ